MRIRRVARPLAPFLIGAALISLPLPALADNEALREAESAYAQLDFDRVLGLLEQARAQPMTPDEKLRAIELTADIDAIYERPSLAQAKFVELLHALPTYRPPADAPPKIKRAFAAAQEQIAAEMVAQRPSSAQQLSPTLQPSPAQQPSPALQPSAATQPPPAAVTATAPVYARWWFWTAIGGVAVAGAVTAFVLTRDHQPPHDFGPYPIR